MVDQEPDKYRPRRAFVEAGPDGEAVEKPATGGADDTPAPAPVPDRLDEPEEAAPPLFREAADGADAATVRTPAEDAATAAEDTAAATGSSRRPLAFLPRKPRAEEDESTTLLPRTAARQGVPVADERDDSDEHRSPLGSRARLGLVAGLVAAVVVIGLAIGYAVISGADQPGASGDPSTSTSSPGNAPSAAPGDPTLLGDPMLLTPEAAQPISAKRIWTVQATVRGDSEDAPGAACLGTAPLEGAPAPAQKVLRTLTANGKGPMGALHLAQAYASAADAQQAFAVTAKALGTCAITGNYLESGRVVSGLGDEATGSLIKSVAGTTATGHTVLVARTGRVLDVLDAYQPKQALNVNDVARALATVVGTQCQEAGGACATAVKVTDGPPPPGGDEPGFLTTGDLPPATKSPAPWVATPVEPPAADFSGSQCETVNWSTLAAASKSSRIYLLQDTPGFFGLNDIVLTTKDEAAATKLVGKIRDDWKSCKKRKLTATVAEPVKVTGVATGGARVTGWTTLVEQKTGDSTTRFRVGIAASGSTVAFTFLNPENGKDLTADQWNGVAVRAVQRATQTG